MSKKILSRASLVGGAVCMLVACTLLGCSRDNSSEPSSSASSPSHAKDPALQKKLRAQISDREALSRAQQTIIRKMEAVAAKYNGDLKAASNDPEMITLIRRARDIETNFASNRMHAAEMIRATAEKGAATRRGAASAGAAATAGVRDISKKKEVK